MNIKPNVFDVDNIAKEIWAIYHCSREKNSQNYRQKETLEVVSFNFPMCRPLTVSQRRADHWKSYNGRGTSSRKFPSVWRAPLPGRRCMARKPGSRYQFSAPWRNMLSKLVFPDLYHGHFAPQADPVASASSAVQPWPSFYHLKGQFWNLLQKYFSSLFSGYYYDFSRERWWIAQIWLLQRNLRQKRRVVSSWIWPPMTLEFFQLFSPQSYMTYVN